jgi:hypothetical protein
MPTVIEVAKCFDLLFTAFHTKEFKKSHQLNHWRERDLLPLIRVGLLCYFGKKALPEVEVSTAWTKSGKSRIDFCIADTAVEFAVRNPGKSYTNISASTNTSEVKKLLSWKKGKSVLVLFDFSDSPFTKQDLQWYREHPSFGKGNRTKNAYTVLYFHVVDPRTQELDMHLIEVRRKSRTPSKA